MTDKIFSSHDSQQKSYQFMIISELISTSQFTGEQGFSHNLGHQSNDQTFPPANKMKSELQQLRDLITIQPRRLSTVTTHKGTFS
jgi:hypothetical protein